MSFRDWLSKEDKNFDVDLNSLKSIYKYVLENGEFEGTMQEWIEYAAQSLNAREIAKRLKEMEKK